MKSHGIRFILAVSLLAGCTESTSWGDTATSLPALVSAGSGPLPAAPTLCEWAGSVDALVWGTIADVRLADSPLVRFTGYGEGEWIWDEGCPPEYIRPALALTVDVDHAFVGDLGGRIEVRMGFDQTWALRPMPRRQTADGLEWHPHEGGGPLVPGDSIGLALHRVDEEGVWSLMNEPLFGLDAAGALVFQPRPDGWHERIPDVVQGLRPEQLQRRIAACERGLAGATARRNRMELAYGPEGGMPPPSYMCGVCGVPIGSDVPPGACRTDADCGPGEGCVDGACR